jgi:hypothetical protein
LIKEVQTSLKIKECSHLVPGDWKSRLYKQNLPIALALRVAHHAGFNAETFG